MAELGIRVEETTSLKPGDVMMVKVMLTDRSTGQQFPWRRFACVVKVHNHRFMDLLTLKLHPTENDLRMIDLRSTDEVYWVPEDRWPQGVVAARMKHIATGRIKL